MISIVFLNKFEFIKDSVFGLPMPAAVVSFCMASLLGLAVTFRLVHLTVVSLSCGALGMQFHRLTKLMKVNLQLDSTSVDGPGEISDGPCQSVKKCLQQHYYLSELVRELDGVFAPTLLLFTASDSVVLTSMISYFISSSKLEAPLGLYVTRGNIDMGFYVNYMMGAMFLLFMRIGMAAYLNEKVRPSEYNTSKAHMFNLSTN